MHKTAYKMGLNVETMRPRSASIVCDMTSADESAAFHSFATGGASAAC